MTQPVPQDTARPFRGGHINDGGYSLAKTSDARRDAIAARVLNAQPEALAWVDAANRLTRIYSLAANYGANGETMREIRDAEAAYDNRRARALRALNPTTTDQPADF